MIPTDQISWISWLTGPFNLNHLTYSAWIIMIVGPMSLDEPAPRLIQLERFRSFKSNNHDHWPNELERAGSLDHSTWMTRIIQVEQPMSRIIQAHWVNDHDRSTWMIMIVQLERSNKPAHSSSLGLIQAHWRIVQAHSGSLKIEWFWMSLNDPFFLGVVPTRRFQSI